MKCCIISREMSYFGRGISLNVEDLVHETEGVEFYLKDN